MDGGKKMFSSSWFIIHVQPTFQYIGHRLRDFRDAWVGSSHTKVSYTHSAHISESLISTVYHRQELQNDRKGMLSAIILLSTRN